MRLWDARRFIFKNEKSRPNGPPSRWALVFDKHLTARKLIPRTHPSQLIATLSLQATQQASMDTSVCSVAETLTHSQATCTTTPRSSAKGNKAVCTPTQSKPRTPRSYSKTPTEVCLQQISTPQFLSHSTHKYQFKILTPP